MTDVTMPEETTPEVDPMAAPAPMPETPAEPMAAPEAPVMPEEKPADMPMQE